MGVREFTKIPLARRVVLVVAGAILLSSEIASASTRSESTHDTLIWNEWGSLDGYQVSAECNPGGGTNFACGQEDVDIAHPGGQFSEVTANPRGIVTFVNAIGNIRFQDNTPDGLPVQLKTYRYIYAVRLPQVPTTSSLPSVGEQVHQMIQFWDGSNTLWETADKHTLEASIYWKLNPWDPSYGKIFAYTTDSGGNLVSVDTGITLTPDTNWHVFDVRADLLNRTYAGIAVDNQWNPLTNVPLAQVRHADWGEELALILTAESENAYPGTTNPIVTKWSTQFRDPKLFRMD